MAYIFNGATKIITLTTGTTVVSVRDLWSRFVDWFLTDDNSKYLPAFKTVGGDDIDPIEGTKIPIYSFLENGWKIKPQEANHTLTINDGILLVNGGGDPFINTNGAYTVRINYQQPVQAISFSSGGSGTGGLDVEQSEQLLRIYQSLMLDPNAPVTTTTNKIAFSDVVINLLGNPETEITGIRE